MKFAFVSQKASKLGSFIKAKKLSILLIIGFILILNLYRENVILQSKLDQFNKINKIDCLDDKDVLKTEILEEILPITFKDPEVRKFLIEQVGKNDNKNTENSLDIAVIKGTLNLMLYELSETKDDPKFKYIEDQKAFYKALRERNVEPFLKNEKN